MSDYILEADGISKRFPGVQALDGACLRIRTGEVHALLGENGAGKSTMIKILFGVYQGDSGKLIIKDREFSVMSPKLAYELGMAMIPQERTLAGHMTVGENLLLGREPRGRWGVLDRNAIFRMADDCLEKYEIDLDSRATANSLGAGAQQLVELVRALMCDARIIFMDEPTSGLTEGETQILFEIIKRLKKQGVAIVYITHRLEEVFRLTDKVTVLRDGKTVSTLNTSETTSAELIQLMAGKAVSEEKACSVPPGKEVLLRVTVLNRGSKVKDISFTVRNGEIVGLAGLLGSGRSELLKCIFGSDQIDSGKIEVHGRECLIRSPKDAIAAGIGFLPENRRREGLCLKMTSTDNIVLAVPEKVFKYGVTNKKRRTEIAGNSVRDVDFNPNYMDVECGTLSGGNQQKALLARWLSRNCDVLMLDEPTNGIDVNTKSEIHNLIRQLAAKGKGILIVSSDFPELLALCHHIIVLRDGRITMDISNSELTESELLGYAAGQHMGA